MKVLETQFSRYTLGDDQVVTATPRDPELEVTPDLVQRILDDLEAFLEATPRPLLWDRRAVVPVEPSAWRAIIDRVEKLTVALAILATDERGHGLGALPGVIDALLVPVRLFTDEEEARRWLLQFVDPVPTAAD